MTLHGKTAIVTGGANGIGKAIARRFLTDGAAVVIADHDEVAGAAAIEELKPLGNVSFVAADVSESLDVHNLVAETLDGRDAIDILVNNAGIVHAAPFLDLQEEDFDRVMRVNLKGAFLCAQAAARAMVRRIEDGGPAGNDHQHLVDQRAPRPARATPLLRFQSRHDATDGGHGGSARPAWHPRQCHRPRLDPHGHAGLARHGQGGTPAHPFAYAARADR